MTHRFLYNPIFTLIMRVPQIFLLAIDIEREALRREAYNSILPRVLQDLLLRASVRQKALIDTNTLCKQMTGRLSVPL